MTPMERAASYARFLGTTLGELRGPRCTRDIVHKRWLISATLRKRGMSYPQIGRVLNRDHTTIMHGIRQIGGME